MGHAELLYKRQRLPQVCLFQHTMTQHKHQAKAANAWRQRRSLRVPLTGLNHLLHLNPKPGLNAADALNSRAYVAPLAPHTCRAYNHTPVSPWPHPNIKSNPCLNNKEPHMPATLLLPHHHCCRCCCSGSFLLLDGTAMLDGVVTQVGVLLQVGHTGCPTASARRTDGLDTTAEAAPSEHSQRETCTAASNRTRLALHLPSGNSVWQLAVP